MKRVIYVIPYMSIIDQTAAVFSGLLGAEMFWPTSPTPSTRLLSRTT